MLRKEIEDLMKKNKQTCIAIYLNDNDELAMLCMLQSGYLVDCWGHRIDRKKDYKWFLQHDGTGNADKVNIVTGERIAILRNNVSVAKEANICC